MRLSTIGELTAALGLPGHVLRFWETEFHELRPVRSRGSSRGQRHYRPEDVALVRGIQKLLHGHGFTLDGLRRVLRERGVEFVRAVGRGEAAGDPLDALVAGLAVASLAPDRRDALITALADPVACAALADRCLQGRRESAADA